MPNHAFVIGIDQYWTDSTSLTGAVADAIDFSSWLIETSELKPANLHLGLLRTKKSPAVPAALAGCRFFEASLDGLTDLLGDYDRNPRADIGRLYFYFSGHGAASSNPVYVEEAIALAGFSDTKWNKALEVGSLRAALKGIGAAERFLFIDGCRNAVTSDYVKFGNLGYTPRRAPGVPQTFELRATALGREAAETKGRGLFSRHLGEGLRGSGSAKRWDLTANNGSGGYIVRWRALSSYVGGEVDVSAAAVQAGQLVSIGGEYPATADPQFAEFAADRFQPVTVRITLRKPAPAPAGAELVARRNDSDEPDLNVRLTA